MKICAPWRSFPADHLEQLSRSAAALTVDPYKNTLYYFFPLIGAYFNYYQELRGDDPGLEAMMPQEPTRRILAEIQLLTNCAGIQREIAPYIGLNFQFASCGGSYSLTQPALFLPTQHLFRQNGKNAFPQEQPAENLREHPWIFSDDQVRFLICRELGHIKENNVLLRIAIKVSILAAIFMFFTMPGWPVGLCLFLGSVGIYILSERLFQARADVVGATILGRRINNPKQAYRIGIETLEKQRQQNLQRRENSWIAKLYITQWGDNRLDFIHPYLTTRINHLTTCEKKL